MTALAGGIVALILGIIGLIVWWGSFLILLKGGIPVILILGGALATYLGVEELKDKRASEDFDTESADLKNEVASLKEEIQELKDEKKESPEE